MDSKQALCEPCTSGSLILADQELDAHLGDLENWAVAERDGIKQLLKVYPFQNYTLALEFTNRLALLAESEGHHPAILLEWGRVEVRWWTHKIKGLHRNDVIMATKTDELVTL
ncbi:MAG: 4a-hydroxytetrahydrobiopterin dehydratase [Flavobacteriales bacterium]|jgi:4a-hydroxytetrahydrobiopterin dehydratase